MTTFANGESGLSVRTKINNVLQHTDGTAGELVINEAGADVDFRVESDTNANALFVDGATGNVGIGTSSPAAALHLQGTSSTEQRTLRLAFDGTYYAELYQNGSGGLEYKTFGGLPHIWFQGGSERLRIDASGNVGIGTSSPQVKLDVIGDAYISGTLFPNSIASYSGDLPINIAGNSFIVNAGATERMRIDASGNVGIGVTPSAWGAAYKALDVSNNYALFNNGGSGVGGAASNAFHNGTNWIYKTSNPATKYHQEVIGGLHAWFTAPSGAAGTAISFTQVMTLDASGNLLIGTATSGASKLRISGLPTSSAGLSAGDVWNDGGTLKIA